MHPYKKLIGDRIYLSPRGASPAELELFSAWMNDTEVTDYIGRTQQLVTFEGEEAFLKDSAMDSKNRHFTILTLGEDKMIGTVSLEKFNWVDRSAILGIFIGDKDYRSNGYGTEAIRLLLEFGFRYLNLHSIRLDLLAINERALKCYRKCGFKDTGRDREAIFLNGSYYDKLHMDILESEFTGSYIRNTRLPIESEDLYHDFIH